MTAAWPIVPERNVVEPEVYGDANLRKLARYLTRFWHGADALERSWRLAGGNRHAIRFLTEVSILTDQEE